MRASRLSYRLRMPSRQEYGSAERLDGALPIQGIGLFHRQCAFPSLAPRHVRGQALLSTSALQALEKSGRPPEWQAVPAWINFFQRHPSTSFCLIGAFREGFAGVWNKSVSRGHRTGALHHHLQKPRKGRSYMGSVVRHARQGTRPGSLTQNLRPLLIGKRHQLAACFSQHTQPALA